MLVKHHCVYNNSFHILQISHFNIHELLIHFIIELSEIFNLSLKPNMRFLSKISNCQYYLQHSWYYSTTP